MRTKKSTNTNCFIDGQLSVFDMMFTKTNENITEIIELDTKKDELSSNGTALLTPDQDREYKNYLYAAM